MLSNEFLPSQNTPKLMPAGALGELTVLTALLQPPWFQKRRPLRSMTGMEGRTIVEGRKRLVEKGGRNEKEENGGSETR